MDRHRSQRVQSTNGGAPATTTSAEPFVGIVEGHTGVKIEGTIRDQDSENQNQLVGVLQYEDFLLNCKDLLRSLPTIAESQYNETQFLKILTFSS